MSENINQSAREELSRHPTFQQAPEESKQWLCSLYSHVKQHHGTTLRAPAAASITLDPNYASFHNVRTTAPGFYISLYREPDMYDGVLDEHDGAVVRVWRPRKATSRIDVTNSAQLDAVKRLLDRAWRLKQDKLQRMAGNRRK